MSAEENKAQVRRAHEAISAGDLDTFVQFLAPDVVDHSLPPGFPSGAEGSRQFIAMLRSAFPDFRVTADDVIAEGDTVVARVTARGTHRGEFMGIPATGKEATWSTMEIVRIVNGKTVERWAESDALGLMQQLGLIPAPDQSGA